MILNGTMQNKSIENDKKKEMEPINDNNNNTNDNDNNDEVAESSWQNKYKYNIFEFRSDLESLNSSEKIARYEANSSSSLFIWSKYLLAWVCFICIYFYCFFFAFLHHLYSFPCVEMHERKHER